MQPKNFIKFRDRTVQLAEEGFLTPILLRAMLDQAFHLGELEGMRQTETVLPHKEFTELQNGTGLDHSKLVQLTNMIEHCNNAQYCNAVVKRIGQGRLGLYARTFASSNEGADYRLLYGSLTEEEADFCVTQGADDRR